LIKAILGIAEEKQAMQKNSCRTNWKTGELCSMKNNANATMLSRDPRIRM
jgi:hypothetical protein